jgi:hypothetical protein
MDWLGQLNGSRASKLDPRPSCYEARLALDLVAKSGVNLSAQEHQEVLEAIGKIDEAFAAVGGT